MCISMNAATGDMHMDREWLMKHRDEMPEILLFYGHKTTDEITEMCLSQWYPCEFEAERTKYTSAEQYMMAEKARLFGDEEIRAQILKTSDPAICKKLGRKVRNFNQEKWNKNRENIARKGNFYKFSQNAKLREFLLSTGDKILAEASPRDRIWGIGMGKNNPDALDPAKWRGRNLLGFAIMSARKKIAFMDNVGEFDGE